MRLDPATQRFLDTKLRALKARAVRLNRLTPRRVGLRPADLPYAPSSVHFRSANRRLGRISTVIGRQIAEIDAAGRRRRRSGR